MPDAETLKTDNERQRLIQAVHDFKTSGDLESAIIADSILDLLEQTNFE